MRPSRRTVPAALAAAALALAGCTDTEGKELGTAGRPSESADPAVVATVAAPPATAVIGADGAADLAAQTSATFFTDAEVVVLASEADALRGASAAFALGVPVLLDGPAATAELERLGARSVLVVGEVSDPAGEVEVVDAPQDDAALAELVGASVSAEPVAADGAVAAVVALDPGQPALLAAADPAPAADGTPPAEGEAGDPSAPEAGATTAPATGDAAGAEPTGTGAEATPASEPTEPGGEATEPGVDSTEDDGEESSAAELPATERPDPAASDVVVMTTGDPAQAAAVANARTAGARVQTVPGGDPRATSTTVQETAANEPGVVVGLGTAFGDPGTLEWRTRTAATGTELPGGGQLVMPGKTYVALYGSPITSALGVLGEQGPEATVERARAHAASYADLTDTYVVPALEIISTVASAGPGDDGNYSGERPVEELRPLVDLAHEQGLYVVLDLQPGRTDFVTQARRYEELLAMPNVGLALDPEWRLGPDEVHMRQIGHVDVAEVNQVVTYLADLTRERALPQKLLVLHQFQVRMIPGVDTVDQSRSELAVLIHADGQGGQGAKQGTWATLRANAPSVRWWGWKNFYDEDVPMLTPEQTMQVQPVPNFISYQ
ncbi:hypothetical protein V5H98_10300 [Georgenia sp. M64]|uniref:hypothetical protein n=1 Tax=Georgenia sp. M64 TaxID=3120520 RepID=UPI0030E266E8